jgi:hypothetical protein
MLVCDHRILLLCRPYGTYAWVVGAPRACALGYVIPSLRDFGLGSTLTWVVDRPRAQALGYVKSSLLDFLVCVSEPSICFSTEAGWPRFTTNLAFQSLSLA